MKASLLLAVLLLAACDAGKPYPDLADKNLRVQTSSSGANVVMGVYRCNSEYEGSVALDQPVVHVGIPAGERRRLVFEFHSPGLLARTSIKKEVQLLPRLRYRYDALVTYKNEVYGVSLREIDPLTGEVRDVDPMAGC